MLFNILCLNIVEDQETTITTRETTITSNTKDTVTEAATSTNATKMPPTTHKEGNKATNSYLSELD